MSITNQLRIQLQQYHESTGKSYYKIHKEMIASGYDITYNTLRAFSASETKGNGITIDIINDYLEENK